MSAIFGETLTFTQAEGQPVRLVVFGDDMFARYETDVDPVGVDGSGRSGL